MISGWKCERLEDLTTKIGSGATPLGGEAAYKPQGIALFRSLNVYDDGFREEGLARIDDVQASRLSNVVVEPNDVLLNITGASVARCCVAPLGLLPARVNQHVSIIRPDAKKLHHKFLHYLLISPEFKKHLLLTGEDGGTTRQALTKAQLQNLLVKCPAQISEQQRIVAILDKAFEAIATAKANTKKNLHNASALFNLHLKSAFDPASNQTKSGWRAYEFSEIAKVQSGSGFPLKYQGKVKNGIPFYKVSDMNLPGNERKMVCENNSITEETRRVLRANLFPKDSIIFPKIGGAIATNKKRLTTAPCCVDNNVMGVIPRPEKVSAEFLYYFFLAHDLSEFANDAHLPSIKSSTIEAWRLCIPTSLCDQARMVGKFNSLNAETQRLESIYQRKLAALEELKKSLLHQAFTAQL